MARKLSAKKSRELARANNDAYFRSRKAPGPLKCEVGDEVCYTRYFLKSIGVGPTSDAWRRRGVVIGFSESGIVQVHWKDDDEPMYVQPHHLAFMGANRRRCE